MVKREHVPLLIGLAIPILMVFFVTLAVFIPRLFSHPEYDFLYSVGDASYDLQYSVRNGVLVQNSYEESQYPQTAYGGGDTKREVKLYLHDVSKNEGKEISFAEASKFRLSNDVQSPDGFEIIRGGGGGGIFPLLFYSGSGDYDTRYLKGGGVSKRLELKKGTSDSYSYYDFTFLGWLLR
ncbi:MAG: hypothetical protein Q7S60_02745 [bacterium]|nr:hypothetical protein [bacterium]